MVLIVGPLLHDLPTTTITTLLVVVVAPLVLLLPPLLSGSSSSGGGGEAQVTHIEPGHGLGSIKPPQ